MYLNRKAQNQLNLILESIFSTSNKKVEAIPLDKLKGLSFFKDKIKGLSNFFKSFKDLFSKKDLKESTIEESSIKKEKKPKEAKLQKAQMGAIDTCLTAILKIIGRKDLIEKCRGNSFVFLMNYIKDNGEMIEITKMNKKDLKRGHIITWLDDSKFKAGKFTGFQLNDFDPDIGIYTRPTSFIGGVAHFGLIIDPEKEIILHNTFVGGDRNGDHLVAGGSGLKLEIEKYPIFKKSRSKKKIYVLDYNVIKKMRCNKLKD